MLLHTSRKIPLGATDVEVQTCLKPKTTKLTYLNPTTFRQVENRDMCAAL
jgi:hypothetical protein